MVRGLTVRGLDNKVEKNRGKSHGDGGCVPRAVKGAGGLIMSSFVPRVLFC